MTTNEPTGLYIAWIREEGLDMLVARDKHRTKVAWGKVPGWRNMTPKEAASWIFHKEELGGCAKSPDEDAIICEVFTWGPRKP